MDKLFKKCPRCKKKNEFGVGQGYCKSCRNRYAKKRYATNPQHRLKYRVKHREIQRIARERNRNLKNEYLLSHPCVDCGNTDIRVLDFDHRDPKNKSCEVSQCATIRTERLMDEIKKCDVRCANCHRIKHYNDKCDWPRPGRPRKYKYW